MITRVRDITRRNAKGDFAEVVEAQVVTNIDGTISLYFQGDKRTPEYNLTQQQWEALKNHP